MISIYTAEPKSLLGNLRRAAAGAKIGPWECDREGDFFNGRRRSRRRAWLRPSAGGNVLNFSFIGPEGIAIDRSVYGLYHGRFLEMLLTHFADQFAEASITPQPDGGDRFIMA